MSLKGKLALVFGGTGGIGREILFELARNGADTLLISRNIEKAMEINKIVEKLAKTHETAHKTLEFDVNITENVSILFQKIEKETQIPSILINAIGTNKNSLLIKQSEADIEAILHANLTAAVVLYKHAARLFLKNKVPAKLLTIGSIVGEDGNAGQAVYSASKAGLIGLTKSVAKEYGGKGIRANLISPGFIDVGMTEHVPREKMRMILERIPVQRLGNARDVAKLACFLAGSGGDYITGQVIRVDGGLNL